MKLREKRGFQFAVTVIICVVRLENFVEPFKQEAPEVMHRSKIANTIGNMCRIVMIRFDGSSTVELGNLINKATTKSLVSKVCLP